MFEDLRWFVRGCWSFEDTRTVAGVYEDVGRTPFKVTSVWALYTTQRVPVCKYFLFGTCKFGDHCHNLHTKLSSVTAPKRTVPVATFRGDTKQKRPLQIRKPEDIPSTSRSDLGVRFVQKRLPSSHGPPATVQKTRPEPDVWMKSGDGFQIFAKLESQGKGVAGITIPMNSNKLYSGHRDGSIRVWDCSSGCCIRVRNLGREIGCLISEGTWVFAGAKDTIFAWNVAEKTIDDEPFRLTEPLGKVSALISDGQDLLFAATENGTVLAYRGSPKNTNPFKLTASLKGHTKPVLCLAYGSKTLYSGSADTAIRVWDPTTFQCLRLLKGHSDTVTSLVCWGSCLLSSSLDKKIHVWAIEEEELQLKHTQEMEHGVLSLSGMNDLDKRSVLFCSLGDGSVRLQELPGFTGRGKVVSRQKLGTVVPGPSDLFFIGDGCGTVAVWKWTQV